MLVSERSWCNQRLLYEDIMMPRSIRIVRQSRTISRDWWETTILSRICDSSLRIRRFAENATLKGAEHAYITLAGTQFDVEALLSLILEYAFYIASDEVKLYDNITQIASTYASKVSGFLVSVVTIHPLHTRFQVTTASPTSRAFKWLWTARTLARRVLCEITWPLP